MLWAGLLLGLTGGLHCIGMCSPLLAAVSAKSTAKLSMVWYNLGRIFMYGLLGFMAASFGTIARLFQFQDWVSWILGTVLILTGIGMISRLQIPHLKKWIAKLVMILQHLWRSTFQKRNPKAIFLLGAINGLLPCGLTYMAMLYGLLANSLFEGWLYMIMFGLGTVPMMHLAPWLLNKVALTFSFSFNRLASVILICSGLLIMGRSLMPHDHQMQSANAGNATEVLCK